MERTASDPIKIAVFCSGISRGSNLEAMFRYFQQHNLPVRIALAVFSRPDSPAYALAGKLGICTTVVSTRNMERFESEALAVCQQNGIELIALAGFMKQLSERFIKAVQIPILNIHPALLPKYGGKGMFGLAVHKAVFASKDKLSGASIHLVDPDYDHGRVLAQKSIDISDCTTCEEVAAKVLTCEHELYGQTIYDFLSGKIA